jgi:hypothetical protein
VKTLTASEVLDRHRLLCEQMRDPTIARYIDSTLENILVTARKKVGLERAQREITSMIHPAANPPEFRRMLEKDLRDATTFQVTAEMVDIVSAVYEKSRESVIKVHQEELPAPCGFIWLDKMQLMPDRNGKIVGNRAISWGPRNITYSDGTVKPGITVTTWFSARDRDEYWTDEEEKDWLAVHPMLDVLYSHSTIIGFGERIGTAFPDKEGPDRYDFLMWLHTLWAFMDTDVVTSSSQAVPRSFRRRAERTLKNPDVHVVLLRRVSVVTDPDAEAQHREVDWSSRWIVQGHYRHLEEYEGLKHHAAPDYTEKAKKCALCGSRVTWVHAYVKGPEGKPLRVHQDTIYKLSR